MRLDLIDGLWASLEEVGSGGYARMGYFISAASSICFPGCFPLPPASAMLKDPENGQVKQRPLDWMDGTFEIISPNKLFLLKVAHVKSFVTVMGS